MKNHIFRVILLLFIFISSSCKKDNSPNSTSSQQGTSLSFTSAYAKVNDIDIGVLHNEIMIAGIDTSQFDFSNSDNFYNSVSEFVNNFLLVNEPSFADIQLTNKFASFIMPDTIIEILSNIQSDWSNLNEMGMMSLDEVALLTEIKSLITFNLSGELTNAQFQFEMDALASENENSSSLIANSVFEISKASYQHWIKEDNLDPQAAPWFALDAAGALVGGTIQAIDGGNIVKGALIGAASASLRLVGTIARGITRYFS